MKLSRAERQIRHNQMAGKRFGRLVVIGDGGHDHNGIKAWICRCDCGTEKTITVYNVIKGHSKSCGCLKRDTKANVVHGESLKGHESTEYQRWKAMKRRCLCKKEKSYKHYGGRGIKVCERWVDSFSNFLSDMGRCPEGMTLERVNNNGNYDPSNCRWATRLDQGNNTRRNRILEFNGEKMSVTQWARKIGINKGTLQTRVESWGNTQRVLTEPLYHSSGVMKKYQKPCA